MISTAGRELTSSAVAGTEMFRPSSATKNLSTSSVLARSLDLVFITRAEQHHAVRRKRDPIWQPGNPEPEPRIEGDPPSTPTIVTRSSEGRVCSGLAPTEPAGVDMDDA